MFIGFEPRKHATLVAVDVAVKGEDRTCHISGIKLPWP